MSLGLFLCLFFVTGCQCSKNCGPIMNHIFNREVGTEQRLAKYNSEFDELARSADKLDATRAIQPSSEPTIRFQSPDGSGTRNPISNPNLALAEKTAPTNQANVVKEVILTGNNTLANHQLLRNIRTREGRYFDPDLLQQDINEIYGMPEVKRINGPYVKHTDEGVVITIDVVERNAMTTVEFIGNRGITDRALKKEAGLEDGDPLDRHAIRMAKSKLEEYYREKGYPKTQIEIMEGTEADDQKVVFLIHEDQKQRVWDVKFEGNEFATSARLRNFIKSKPGILKLFGGLAKRDEIEQDVKRLDNYYKKYGFFNVRIGREISESNDGRWLTLRFIIDEGPRYKVRNVSFIGNESFGSDDLNQLLQLKPGQEMPDFNSAKMSEDVVALRDLYGSQGFVHAKVEAEPRFLEEPGMLDLVYKVSEGQQWRVGRINVHIEGDYGITKREVVLNRLSLRPGDLIDVREIEQSERRLGSARIFAGGQPGTGAGPRIVVRHDQDSEINRMARRPGAPSGSGTRSSGGSGTRY